MRLLFLWPLWILCLYQLNYISIWVILISSQKPCNLRLKGSIIRCWSFTPGIGAHKALLHHQIARGRTHLLAILYFQRLVALIKFNVLELVMVTLCQIVLHQKCCWIEFFVSIWRSDWRWTFIILQSICLSSTHWRLYILWVKRDTTVIFLNRLC